MVMTKSMTDLRHNPIELGSLCHPLPQAPMRSSAVNTYLAVVRAISGVGFAPSDPGSPVFERANPPMVRSSQVNRRLKEVCLPLTMIGRNQITLRFTIPIERDKLAIWSQRFSSTGFIRNATLPVGCAHSALRIKPYSLAGLWSWTNPPKPAIMPQYCPICFGGALSYD